MARTKSEELLKDKNTKDDLTVVDKEEDSIFIEAGILGLVRNIKKDPDALGGKYEEALDPDVKKEKGSIANSSCWHNSHLFNRWEFEESPQQLNVRGPPKEPKESLPKEPKESAVEIEVIVVLAEKLAPVTQPPPPHIPVKVEERLRGKQLHDLPLARKEKEISGIWSIT